MKRDTGQLEGDDVTEPNGTADARTAGSAAPSVRTPEKPMAFTWRELWRGAWMAWAVFMAIVTVTILLFLIVSPPEGMYGSFEYFIAALAFVCAAVVSAVVVTATAPLVRVIGNALQRVASPAVHILVFAAFGVVVAQVVIAVSGLLLREALFRAQPGSLIAIILSLVVALSTASGWSFTYWRSRHPRPRKS
jgi:magnesium-transporting ATPase (P-type)